MQKITPCLWFDGNAMEAVNFYISVFKNSKVGEVMYYGDAGPGKKGDVLCVNFELEGQGFMALNGGPEFHFTPAISLFVDCATQQEIDELWDRLLDGGQPLECGWLTDRFGVSWQIVPGFLGEMLRDTNRERADRVMRAMLKMVKLDIALLKQAYEQG